MSPETPTALDPDLASLTRSRPITIQDVKPSIDCGRYPVKREIGDRFTVSATVFRDGHGEITAVARLRPDPEQVPDAAWREVPMTLVNKGLDLWQAEVSVDSLGRWEFTVEAWDDPFGSWAADTRKKRAADQPLSLELTEGRALLDRVCARADGEDEQRLRDAVKQIDSANDDQAMADVLLGPDLEAVVRRWPDRSKAVRHPTLEIVVEPVIARYAAWYEMFPRSQGTRPGRSATFKDCIRRLPEVRAMGFDVLYFVPIHPIGEMFRKGKNNTFPAKPGEPGSPYAIGSKHGGHKAIEPSLGTLEEFRELVAAAEEHGMQVALDIAIQCAQDHPWIKEHPEWFEFRPDGSIKYAENPPKKYQDIVNVNFYGPHQQALWEELKSVFLFWCEQGVKIFRVDNPHTKPVPFWEWVIREVKRVHPDAIFLAEAFTRPPMLKMLAKVGYSQSYTYFTWRNFKWELEQYCTELTQTDDAEYLRPNFFANTPDILPEFLQRGGRPAFMIRGVLAATLSSVYGLYNGFELCENRALPGKEEYLDSEKYEFKVWDWDRPGNIKDYITAINRIRRENPALHELHNLRFHHCDDEDVIFYSKSTPDGTNRIFIAVNLDPFEAHIAELAFPLDEMGLGDADGFAVEELFTGVKRLWRGARHRVSLDPKTNPATILRVTPWKKVDFVDPCY